MARGEEEGKGTMAGNTITANEGSAVCGFFQVSSHSRRDTDASLQQRVNLIARDIFHPGDATVKLYHDFCASSLLPLRIKMLRPFKSRRVTSLVDGSFASVDRLYAKYKFSSLFLFSLDRSFEIELKFPFDVQNFCLGA